MIMSINTQFIDFQCKYYANWQDANWQDMLNGSLRGKIPMRKHPLKAI